MRGWRASWRVALRHGRRDLAKAKGRTALVVVMIATPVLLTTALITVVASNTVSEDEMVPSQLGQAEAAISPSEGQVVQDVRGVQAVTGKAVKPEVARAEARRVLGGSLGQPVTESDNVKVHIGERGTSIYLRGVDSRSRTTRGMYEVTDGRAPRGPAEIMVNQALVRRGAEIGRTITVGTRPFTVVGVGLVDPPMRGGDDGQAIVLPDQVEKPDSTSYLFTGRAVTWPMVRELNRAGYVALSRYVLDHGLTARQQAAVEREVGTMSGTSEERAVLVIVATSVMIEIVLLACPAFAVGVRRQRRELALLAATGASPRQLRRIVLGQAAVIGVLSSVAACLVGIGVAALVVELSPDLFAMARFGPFDIRWSALALVMALGTLSAVAAAYVPAVQASRQDVATVLAGRRGEVRSRSGWPALGSIVVGLGVFACFSAGTRPGGELVVAGSTLAIVVGVVMMTPALVGGVGRLGTRLPLPLRIAARDTARQRSRSAPAVAAIMASVAGVTTMAIGSASDFQQSRDEYVYTVAPGRAVVTGEGDDFDEVLATVDRQGGSWIPMASLQEDGTVSTSLRAPEGAADLRDAVQTVYVASPATLRAWGVRLPASDAAFLEAGGVLSSRLSGPLSRDAQVQLATYHYDESGEGEPTGPRVPARVADLRYSAMTGAAAPSLRGAVISPETARRYGLHYAATQAISPVGAPTMTPDAQDALNERLADVSDYASVQVERGFQESWTLALLALFSAAVLAVLIGTLTATALALNDAKPDFATLAAVGASPRTRRWTAGSQALVLALLGSVLGVVVGFAPGLAVTWPLTAQSYTAGGSTVGAPTISVPWLMLLGLVVVVPLGAAAVATTFTRSRLTLVRRVAQ